MTSSIQKIAFSPLLLVTLAVGQFVASLYTRLTGHGQDISRLAGREGLRPPEVPAGYAFSIWLVIFTLSVVYALCHATRGRAHEGCRSVSGPAALLFLCSIVWMLVAQIIGSSWILVTIIVVMWAASAKALLTVAHTPSQDMITTRLLSPLFGLYTGWLTAALFLTITGTFAKQVGTLGLSLNAYALLTLAPACALALALLQRTKGNIYAFGAFMWALAGIIVANLQTIPANMPIVGAAAAGSILLTLGFLAARRTKCA